MIRKLIHYCWFGSGPKNETIRRCMHSWKQNLSGYEFREWSEKDLSNINNQYVREAYAAKKWAFVSDWFRLYALYTQGGIYLDTDVEVFKPFDDLLSNKVFLGSEYLENIESVGTAVMGSEAGHPLIGNFLKLYDTLSFIKPDGSEDTTPNTVRFSAYLKKQYNLPQLYTDAEPIKITQDSYIYPAKLLYWPSEDSYCIHHFDASWVDDYKITEKLSLRLGNGCLKLIRYKRQKTNASDIVLPNNQTLLFRIEKSSHRTFMLVWQKECA